MDKNDRRFWDDEDWDKLSSVRRIHRLITGVPLKDETIMFYCILAVALIVINFIVN